MAKGAANATKLVAGAVVWGPAARQAPVQAVTARRVFSEPGHAVERNAGARSPRAMTGPFPEPGRSPRGWRHLPSGAPAVITAQTGRERPEQNVYHIAVPLLVQIPLVDRDPVPRADVLEEIDPDQVTRTLIQAARGVDEAKEGETTRLPDIVVPPEAMAEPGRESAAG